LIDEVLLKDYMGVGVKKKGKILVSEGCQGNCKSAVMHKIADPGIE
jgi:hypothetical protein